MPIEMSRNEIKQDMQIARYLSEMDSSVPIKEYVESTRNVAKQGLLPQFQSAMAVP